MARIYALGALAVGLLALVLQFSLTIPARLDTGDNLGGALVFFFSYYTILSNMALVLVYLSVVTGWRWLDWFRRATTRGMMAAVMTLVATFYHFFLAGLWQPQGLFAVCDILLHYVTPILYVVWWLLFEPKRHLQLRDIPLMLLPTLIYFIYAMARGAIVGSYPYPILEANRIGYAAVGLNAVYMTLYLTLLCGIVVLLDRALPLRASVRT